MTYTTFARSTPIPDFEQKKLPKIGEVNTYRLSNIAAIRIYARNSNQTSELALILTIISGSTRSIWLIFDLGLAFVNTIRRKKSPINICSVLLNENCERTPSS